MSLVRSVQVAVGFAAASGMLAVLSGSALAADNGSGTTSQLVPEQTVRTQTTVKTSTTSVISVQGSQQGDKGQDGAVGANDPALQQGPSDKLSNDKTVPVSGVSVDITAKKYPAGQVMLMDQSPNSKSETEVTGEVTQLLSSNAPRVFSEAGIVTVSTPVVVGGGVEAPITYRETTLTIKPKITNRIAPIVTDLATGVPSAPVHDQRPNPTQSSGLLGNLTAQLAGTIVPQFVLNFAEVIRGVTLPVGLLVLSIILFTAFTSNYGFWLRRSGFATAARSDASLSLSSSFATPFGLGYVSLPWRNQSPLFNGGRNESSPIVVLVRNAFRKEEMS